MFASVKLTRRLYAVRFQESIRRKQGRNWIFLRRNYRFASEADGLIYEAGAEFLGRAYCIFAENCDEQDSCLKQAVFRDPYLLFDGESCRFWQSRKTPYRIALRHRLTRCRETYHQVSTCHSKFFVLLKGWTKRSPFFRLKNSGSKWPWVSALLFISIEQKDLQARGNFSALFWRSSYGIEKWGNYKR